MSAAPEDFELIGVVDIVPPNTITIDEAIGRIFDVWKWPKLGGPSGKGWSYWSAAFRCGEYFRSRYDATTPGAAGWPADYFQIGALFHVLEALYYGAGLGNAYVLPDGGGLVSDLIALPGRRARFKVPPTAADDLLAGLKAMCADEELPGPLLNVVLDAERAFNIHTAWWDGREDMTPLGIEVHAKHPFLPYTVRYDMVARVGKDDPLLPQGVYIIEKKSAAWLDQKYLDGWSLDGEVLGELMCWEPSGMAKLFGPLAGVIVDAVSKGKTHDCKRTVIPATVPQVAKHEKLIRLQSARVQEWRAHGWYPQNYAACHDRYGRCSNWDRCVAGLDGVDDK